jgi:hypothetical protein
MGRRPAPAGAANASEGRAAALLADGLLSGAEVRALLHVSRRTVYRLPIPYVLVGRVRRYPRWALVAYVAERLRGDGHQGVEPAVGADAAPTHTARSARSPSMVAQKIPPGRT